MAEDEDIFRIHKNAEQDIGLQNNMENLVSDNRQYCKNLQLEKGEIKGIEKYKYLGGIFSKDSISGEEIMYKSIN